MKKLYPDNCITLDGRMDEAVWNEVPEYTSFSTRKAVGGQFPENQTFLKILPCENRGYFGVKCMESDMDFVRNYASKDIYQGNAIWIMSPATRTALRLLKDEMGRYLLNDDVSTPFGTSLLGKPVYVSDNMPEIAASKNVIYYGDFKGLATKFSEDINIQVLRERYADEHADGVIGFFEMDATVEDQQKIAKLTMAAS